MKANETKPTPLQYAATTSEAGYRRLEAGMLQMGHLRNALIRHRNAACGSHRHAFTFRLQNAQAVFKCLSCGHETNADVNAAENIRRQGVEILARAGNLSLGVPPETIAVNKRNKTRHKADSRCTRELALRKE